MKRTFCVTLCALCVFSLILQGGMTPARADILDGVAAIGAGNADGDPTNFPALMQDYGGLNFGGAGVPYAFGGVNADSASILLPGNQVDMAVAEILSGNVSLVMLGIGDNDYIEVGDAIALGTLSGAPLAAYQQQVADNIATSVSALQNAGAGVVLGGFANIVHSPVAAAIKANPLARANLETALADGNALVKSAANSQNLSFINFFDLLSAVYAEGSASMGGVEVILDGYGADPHYFWEDPYHAGILVRGVIANLHIQAINEAYGTNVPLLSDLQILELAGLEDEYVVESFEATYAYSNYVTVPEPSALALGAVGLAAVVAVGTRRRRIPSGAFRSWRASGKLVRRRAFGSGLGNTT